MFIGTAQPPKPVLHRSSRAPLLAPGLARSQETGPIICLGISNSSIDDQSVFRTLEEMSEAFVEDGDLNPTSIRPQVENQTVGIHEGEDGLFELVAEGQSIGMAGPVAISRTRAFDIHIPNVFVRDDSIDKHGIILKGKG